MRERVHDYEILGPRVSDSGVSGLGCCVPGFGM